MTVAFLAILAACTYTPSNTHHNAASFAPHAVATDIARGDATAGRRAFLDLSCNACHAVAGDATMPAPSADPAGPVLRDLGELPAEAVAWKIVSQSELDPEGIFDSPMSEPVSAMTERQLADIVVYLRDPAAARAAK